MAGKNLTAQTEIEQADVEILTTAGAAAFLKLSEKSVRMKAKAGVIPGAFVSGRWRFIKQDLIAWLRAHTAHDGQVSLPPLRTQTIPWKTAVDLAAPIKLVRPPVKPLDWGGNTMPKSKSQPQDYSTAIMTVKEAAAYLGLTQKTIRIMAVRGDLAYGKVGRQYRFRKDALDAWKAHPPERRKRPKMGRAVPAANKYWKDPGFARRLVEMSRDHPIPKGLWTYRKRRNA